MNRYAGPPSKATASTTCQKCLKKGHYSYECKTPAQSRPYSSRPSRTQQLHNPKLKPKLDSDTPNDLFRKIGVADEQLARAEAERSRKRRRINGSHSSSRSSSTSSASEEEPQSPPRGLNESEKGDSEKADYSEPSRQGRPDRNLRKAQSPIPPRHGRRRSTERHHRHHQPATKHLRNRSRSRHRDSEMTPGRSNSQERSRSPDLVRGRHHNDRRESDSEERPAREKLAIPRKRSPSPYSRRLALTQSMNM